MEMSLVEKERKEIEQITEDDVKNLICKDATKNEIMLFLNIAKLNGLNPFKREIHLVKYGDNPAQIVTGYETYLKRAERSQQWNGFKVWTDGNIPQMKACIEVYRKDWEKPLYHEVYYEEYVGYKKELDKDGNKVPNKFWKEKPRTMLKKVVISQAFRLTFPDIFCGMPYTADEINTIDADISIEHSGKPDVEIPKSTKENFTPVKNVDPETPAKNKEVKMSSTAQQGMIHQLCEKLDKKNKVDVEQGEAKEIDMLYLNESIKSTKELTSLKADKIIKHLLEKLNGVKK